MASTGKERAGSLQGAGTTGATVGRSSSRLERASVKKSPGYFARSWRRFRRNTLSMISMVVFVLIVLFAFGAPLIARFVSKQDYQTQNLQATFAKLGETKESIQFGGAAGVARVTNTHWLGSDELGRDVLTRLAYGGRISLTVALLAMLLALTMGLLVGAIAGFYGGWVDSALMRLVDVFLSIPGLFLLILISSMFNNNKVITQAPLFKTAGWLVLPLVIASLGWTGISRLIRGEVMAVKSRDYIDAARVLGSSDSRVIFRHILPNVVHIVIIWATLAIPGLILAEASLSYLGFGVQIPTPSWGNMLQDGQRDLLVGAWWMTVFPGLSIFITVLAFNLMGDGLRDALDPRLRRR